MPSKLICSGGRWETEPGRDVGGVHNRIALKTAGYGEAENSREGLGVHSDALGNAASFCLIYESGWHLPCCSLGY